jgi:hypothetical protein
MRKFYSSLVLSLLLSAGLIGGAAFEAEALEGWRITFQNVGGDSTNFANFTICFLDDGTFFVVGFCETGQWFKASARRWAQGGCTGLDPDVAFAFDGQVANGKLKGKANEFEVDASFVVGAWYQQAPRDDAACSGSLQSGTESVTGR